MAGGGERVARGRGLCAGGHFGNLEGPGLDADGFPPVLGASPPRQGFRCPDSRSIRGLVVCARKRQERLSCAKLPPKHAFERWMARIAAKRAAVAIFEGQVNPAWQTAEREALHGETEEWLATFDGKGMSVAYFHQENPFPSECWSDMTHLNATGREKLTETMGQKLEQLLCP